MKKKKNIAIFCPLPFSDFKNYFSPPPLFAMKIMTEPHEKACKLNFYWQIKNCGDFLRSTYKGPLYYISPSKSVWEWSLELNPKGKHLNLIFPGKCVVIFFQGPLYLTKIQTFIPPFFASGPHP